MPNTIRLCELSRIQDLEEENLEFFVLTTVRLLFSNMVPGMPKNYIMGKLLLLLLSSSFSKKLLYIDIIDRSSNSSFDWFNWNDTFQRFVSITFSPSSLDVKASILPF